MVIDAVIARLKAQVPALQDRVDGAADFGQLMQSKSMPSAPVSAFVLWGGIIPRGRPDVATGAYRQAIARAVTIVLVVRSNDRRGEGALDELEPLVEAVLTALCGWAPGDETGVFELGRASISSFSRGTAVFQIDLTISDQLRILA